jgi:hypothetical protein
MVHDTGALSCPVVTPTLPAFQAGHAAVRTLLTGRPSCRVVLRTGRAPAETEPGVLEPVEHDVHLWPAVRMEPDRLPAVVTVVEHGVVLALAAHEDELLAVVVLKVADVVAVVDLDRRGRAAVLGRGRRA